MLHKNRDPLRRMVTVRPRAFFFLALLLLMIFGIALSIQSAQVRRLSAEKEAVQREVLEAEELASELARKLAFTATDEYVEQEARRRFGYMQEGEIRFVVEGEDSYSFVPPTAQGVGAETEETFPPEGSE